MSVLVPVRSIGSLARAALKADGHVIAVFTRSIYVETSAGIACIGDPSIGNGPLNACLAVPVSWADAGVRVGAKLRRHRSLPTHVVIGGLTLSSREATVWRPSDGIKSRPIGPGRGLARLLPLLSRRQPFATAIRLAGRVLGTTASHPTALLGLGPGLTPAGDDFLGGAMVAWQGMGRPDLARRLARTVLPAAQHLTSRISRAHLGAAAQGLGHEALHRVLAKPTAAGLRAIDAIGHSSGWDALAGAVAALSCDETRREPGGSGVGRCHDHAGRLQRRHLR